MIEEAKRPGEYMTAFEDEHGTYIMNSKDLRAIAHVERLTQMGVHSLKIEGRTKSFYYCARTARVYRKAIDDAAAGKTVRHQSAGDAGRSGPPRLYRRLPAPPHPRRLSEL